MKYTLKITSAVALDGLIKKSGELVEVSESVALELLRRGKAEVAENQPVEQVEESASEIEPDEQQKKQKSKQKSKEDETQ
jgi:ribosomal protein L9